MIDIMAKKNKYLPFAQRLILLIVGLFGSCALIIYSLRWEDLGINIDVLGKDISQWFFAGMLVICGIIFSTLLKSALLGKWRLD